MTAFVKSHPFGQETHMFQELLPYVLPAVPTCSNMLAVQNLRRAAIDLCQESRIWRSTQFPLPIGQSSCEYEFEPPEAAQRVRIEWLSYEGKLLEPTTEHQLRKCDSEWLLKKGEPTHFLEMNTKMIRLWPTPNQSVLSAETGQPEPVDESPESEAAYASAPCAVVIRISCKPSITASGMDGDVMDDHYGAIVNGALAYLYLTPGHPWSDPAMGQQYQAAFTQGVQKATYQAVDGNLSPTRTVSYGGL